MGEAVPGRQGDLRVPQDDGQGRSEAPARHQGRRGGAGSLHPAGGQIRYEEIAADLKAHYAQTGDRDPIESGTRFKHLDAYFAGVRAVRIDEAAVDRYITKRREQDAANGTINRELGVLIKMLRLAQRRRKLQTVPTISKLQEAAPRAGFFEQAQFDSVSRRLPADIQVALAIAHTYGWRMQSEVLTLERRQIDLIAGTIRLDVGSTKNGAGRVVYLTPALRGQVLDQIARVTALERTLKAVVPYLFPHLTSTNPKLLGTRKRDFRKAWATARQAAGLPQALRHDLRRTAVRNLVDAGVPERVAMTVTGHKTRSVFDRYHIVSPADLQSATSKLAARAAR